MSAMKFLKNLYEVVSSDTHKSIEWNAQGNGIVILDKSEFMQNSLPTICKTDEYGTFIRQLNNYGFSKVKNANRDEFINERFLRDAPEMLSLLKRKNFSEKLPDMLTIQNNQRMLYSNITNINELNSKLLTEVYYLKEKVTQQEKTINELIRAFIHIFNTQEVKPGKLRIEDSNPDSHLKNILMDLSDKQESKDNKNTEDINIDAFLDEEFDRV